MHTYNQLADLEVLCFSIKNPVARLYAGEAIACYSAGANRAAIVTIWVAVVHDLYQKVEYLADYFEDNAARKCIDEIKALREHKDKSKATDGKDKTTDGKDKTTDDKDKVKTALWEQKILEDAFKEIKMLTPTEHEHLMRIKYDRNLCAHPALNKDGELISFSPELVRTHIRTAIEILLSQPALIGKTATEAFIRDVEAADFVKGVEGIEKILKDRHSRASDRYLTTILIKSLLKVLYEEPNNMDIINRYIWVIEYLVEKYPSILEALDRQKLKNILDKTRESRFPALIRLLQTVKRLWEEVPEFLQESLKHYIKASSNLEQKLEALHFWSEASAIIETECLQDREKRKQFLQILRQKNMTQGVYATLVSKLVRHSIDEFTKSERWYYAEVNAEYLKSLPMVAFLTSEDVKYLLENATNKIELRNCILFMKDIFEQTIDNFPELLPNWETFIKEESYIKDNGKTVYNWGKNMAELAQLIADTKNKLDNKSSETKQ